MFLDESPLMIDEQIADTFYNSTRHSVSLQRHCLLIITDGVSVQIRHLVSVLHSC